METLLFFGKFILASTLLLLFYWAVMRHKASYGLCRKYLTAIPAMSLLMSLLSFDIPVEMPRSIERNVEQIEQRLSPWTAESSQAEVWTPAAPATQAVAENAQSADTEVSKSVNEAAAPLASTPVNHTASTTSYSDWTLWTIEAVSALLILVFVYYIAHVFSIKRRLSREKTTEGYQLIRSDSVNTPFSFGKTIFLPAALDRRSEDMIVRHEKAHIAHHHYLEVWHIEFWTRLCWFNPILWLCRSELRNVHEFEADRDVIRQGADLHSYQSTLLEMVMNESCPVVNGFNHSFIRQRFIEMKSSTAGTLGRVGKVALLLWVVVLFGSFTLRPSSSATVTDWKVPVYPDPLTFVIDATLDEDSTETCFYLYMADSLFHIEEDKPDAVIPVIDHKIHYEMPLNRVTAGRLRGVGPDGKKTELCFEQFFVPGTAVRGSISQGGTLYGWGVYQKSIDRAIAALRHTVTSAPAGYPQWEGKVWERLNINQGDIIGMWKTKSVCFAKDKTLIKYSSNDSRYVNHATIWGKGSFLEDPQGNRYNYLGRYPEKGQLNAAEALIHGVYECFEPMPDNVKEFKIGYTYNDSILYWGGSIREAKEKQKPNFELTVKAASDIPDCAYIIEYKGNQLEGDEVVAELPLDKNRSCTYTTHLDSIVMADVTAIFPDGTVCISDDRLPLVPGEKVEINVHHSYWHVSGGKSNIYRDWSNANDACKSLARQTNLSREKYDSLRMDYLKQHLDQLGCLYYFKSHFNEDFEDIEELPASIMQTQFGREWAAEAKRRERIRAKRLATANNPLWVLESPDEENTTIVLDSLYEPYAEMIKRGAFVLDKEISGKDPNNYYVQSKYYKDNAKNGVKMYKVANKELIKSIRKEHLKKLKEELTKAQQGQN